MVSLKYDPSEMDRLKDLIESEAKGEQYDEITMENVLIGHNMIERIPAAMQGVNGRRIKQVLVVTDTTPIKRGETLLKELAAAVLEKNGIKTELLTLSGSAGDILHADMSGVKKLYAKLGPDKGIVSIGGGTVTDICKYASFLAQEKHTEYGKIPLVVCQTATSGSAFGTNQAVIFIDGVKRTMHALYPNAVIVDLEVIASAPRPLNLAGFGDMLGILISSVDWDVSHNLGMSDSYSSLITRMLEDSGKALLKIDQKLNDSSQDGLQVLAKVLLMMGIVSSMGYGTAPISGFDHVISHALDFEGLATGRRLALHGSQVGLGTAYASVAYNFFVKEFSPGSIDPARCVPSEEEAFNDIVKRFRQFDPDKKSLDEIWSHYAEKLKRWRKNQPLFEQFLLDWEKPGGPRDQITGKLKPAEEIIKALYWSGNPTAPEELNPSVSSEQMKFAFLNARFLRDRFTIADIMGFAGMLDDAFWNRVDAKVRSLVSAAVV